MNIELIKEGKFFIFNSPELDMSGYGYTKTEAADMFIECYKDLFLSKRGVNFIKTLNALGL